MGTVLPALVQPKKLPVSAAAEMGPPVPSRVERAAADVQSLGTQIAGKQQEQGAFEAQQAELKAEQAAKQAEQRAQAIGAERKAVEESAPFKDLQQVEKEAAQARFEPTQRSIQENAALFSLIGVLGFAVGAGSKSNAMQAMSALNGMVQGVQAGDMDRYKQEKTTFDTNLKALVQRSNLLTTQVKRITELAARDKEKANLEMDALLAREQAGFVKQYKDKFGLPATIKYLEQLQKGAQQSLQMAQRADDAERRQIRDEQNKRERLEQQAKDREFQIRLAASLRPVKEPAAPGLKASAKAVEGYMANNILIQDLDNMASKLKDPKIVEGLRKYRIEAFLTEEGKVLNQVLEQEIPSDLRKFLTEVRDVRNNYYLNMSGKAVTGGEALRNYGTVPQPGDTPEVMSDKIAGMRNRVQQMSDLQRTLYGLPDLGKVKLQGMQPAIKPGETYSTTVEQPAAPAAANTLSAAEQQELEELRKKHGRRPQ